MHQMMLIGKTVLWTIAGLAICLAALSFWHRVPSSELQVVSTRAFEARAKTGRLHCFAPQHYSLAEVERTDPKAGTDLRVLLPQDIIDARNVDDISSIVSVIDGKGIYIRYFGYHTLSDTALCW